MPRRTGFGWKVTACLAVALGLYLIGGARVGLWDRDEPRYAQCSREMLQTGDWVVPKFLGDWRTEKPPLIYWCQAAVMRVIGDTPQAARLPSTLAVVLAALLLAIMVRRYAGTVRALWTVAIFCTAGLVIASAKMCITDALLMLLVLVGQACLGILWAHGRCSAQTQVIPPLWIALVFWTATALAGLTKGPQAVGMHLVTVLVLLMLDVGADWRSLQAWIASLRWLRFTRPLMGVPVLVGLTAPWVYLIHQRAPGFVAVLVLRAKQHTATSMEGHGQPFGYHLLLIFGTFFPWSLLLPTAISLAWQHRRSPVVRFAMAATAGPWLLMELVTTKLPFYVLPAFPGLAFLTADALVRCIRGQHLDLVRTPFRFAAGVWAMAALGLAAAPWAASLVSHDIPRAWISAFTLCGIAYASTVTLLLWKRRLMATALALCVGMAVMISILYGGILPNLGFLQLSERLAADLKNAGAYGNEQRLAMIGYKEPSLAFYQGGGAREKDDAYLTSNPIAEWPQWIVITQTLWNRMPASVHEHLALIGSERGVMYAANGREETVLIFRNRRYNP